MDLHSLGYLNGNAFAAPTLMGRRSAYNASIVIGYFMTDDTANGRTTYCSDSTAAGKDSTTYGTDPGTDGRAFILCRHAGTTTQAKQHGCSHCAQG
jgi:hypothetical protein